MRTATIVFPAVLLLGSAHAQNPVGTPDRQDLAAASTRLNAALENTLGQSSLGFATDYVSREKKADDKKAERRAVRLAQVMFLGGGSNNPGSLKGVRGVWTPDLMFAERGDDSFLFARGRMATRDGSDPWALRRSRLVDGNSAPMVVDPGLLLTLLRDMDLRVRHRSVGAIDDRPVERLTVTLDSEQVADWVWAGLVPEAPPVTQVGGNMVLRAGGVFGFAGGAPKPDNTIDLVLNIDPGTRLIRQIIVRTMGGGTGIVGGRIVVAGAGGLRVASDEEEDEEETPEPTGFDESGFPNRRTKNKAPFRYAIRFTDHGQASLPELGERVKKLLGVR